MFGGDCMSISGSKYLLECSVPRRLLSDENVRLRKEGGRKATW